MRIGEEVPVAAEAAGEQETAGELWAVLVKGTKTADLSVYPDPASAWAAIDTHVC
jgi:hypothetical protein